ncbi:MAG: preprotein translocase subunit YajC [Bacteroidales bacterium]|jgi:preprotein translocase subunit YajC|nr:preprotein translocase subunit YajC [Bacteroidales bacterium]MDD2264554.1 preprotein translocase subunit YajC [Bacteroidales bacterium]MDD2831789.1 preprotein translocase subunit YajC [Bacteroidales bacterium]MDD3209314.1 preprotein translocase subunit YajC [Bacteroidales bacterium]MDD3697761.1 preprotein translocase subunit YajC [Bacteroidales bacterium]
MNALVILQEQTTATAAKGGNWTFLIMMVAIFVVMYFLMIRPQKKRQKELKEYRDSLKKGEKVITAGGIYGTIAEVKDNYVLLEVDTNVKIRVDKSTLVKDSSDLQQSN